MRCNWKKCPSGWNASISATLRAKPLLPPAWYSPLKVHSKLTTGAITSPVSPAVMAGTLLEDVLALFREMATLEPDSPCSFHRASTSDDDAAYHDMAQLFGFSASGEAHRYHCDIEGAHDHAACLSRFSRRLQHFFDGEHPTRVTRYRHVDVQSSWTPARTVYTGNYVLTPETLRYFIPFAGLQLRMAGPVLGRLVQAGSGPAFASANLPLLHKRTEEETGQSEFRPGIDRAGNGADLSGEFERQYFGDVMLFTVIELVEQEPYYTNYDEDTFHELAESDWKVAEPVARKLAEGDDESLAVDQTPHNRNDGNQVSDRAGK